MKYFSEDYLDFFKELAANNHKDWFDKNRKRYDKSVKDPFKKFIEDLISETRKLDPSVQIEAKDAIFRINRDIRFSKDKTPYKLDRSAIISTHGRKDHSTPGFYIALGPEKTSIGGGAYFLKPEQLSAVRHHIASNPKGLDKVLKQKAFKDHFEEIKGEANKRLPKELQEAGEKQPLIYNKQFYFMKDDDPNLVTSEGLMDYCIDHFKSALPVQQYFKNAMRV